MLEPCESVRRWFGSREREVGECDVVTVEGGEVVTAANVSDGRQ